MSVNRQNMKAAVSLLFVISGIAGLIYQIVWFKYLSLFLGNTTYAQMTVLAAFLGGLALGNYLFGKKSDTLKNPVKIYSLLELFIGVYCLLYPILSSLMGNIFLSVATGLNISPENILFTALRFFIAAILLLAPTTAMGGTLPVLSKFFVDTINNARKEVALLYFLNSFGAVIGVLFAGFVLIKEFGLEITIYATAFLNILAGLAGFLLSVKSKNILPVDYGLVNESPSGAANSETVGKKTAATVVLVAGISGMAALIYEMVWVRLLINFFGSSTYAFSIMLMAFIGGITVGSLIVSRKYFIKYNYVRLLVFTQAAIAFSTMLVLLFYERLPYFLWNISTIFSKTAQSFEIFLVAEFVICFSLMFLPTLFMGMALPVATEIISGTNLKVGYSVGRIFSVNTIGTVGGVILTGLVFIPLCGIKGSFEIGIALNLFAATILLWNSQSFSAWRRIILSTVLAGGFLLYLLLIPAWNENIMIKGVFRSLGAVPPESFSEFSKNTLNEKIIFYEEGRNATVAVTQSTINPDNKRLIINGKPDASSYFDMPTQVMLGQIPMVLHPNPKTVFVVGFGSGTTIGSVLTHPVEKITCAEISKEVINAAKYFEKENRNCIDDSRLRLVNEDAVTLLKLSEEKYDVIISEPSNPWIAGIGNLFSKEYFERCLAKLNPDGIMVQWFHLYEADDNVVKLVLNTFASVFPQAQMWNSIANDIILVGSQKEITLNVDLLHKKFLDSKIKGNLERIGITNPFTFLSCQSVSPRGFFTMAADAPVNSEIRPLLEFIAPKAFYVGKQSSYIYSFDEKFDTLSNGLLVKEFIKKFPPTKSDITNTIHYLQKTNVNARFAYGLSKYLLDQNSKDYSANVLFNKSYKKLSLAGAASTTLESLILIFPDSAQVIKDYNNNSVLLKTNATTFMKLYSIKNEAEAFIKTTSPDSVSFIKVYLQLAKNFMQNSEHAYAYGMCERVEKIIRANPGLIKLIDAESYYYLGAVSALYMTDYEKVIGYYIALVNLNRDYNDIFHLRRLMSWQTIQNKK